MHTMLISKDITVTDKDTITFTYEYMEVDMLQHSYAGPDDIEETDEDDDIEVPNDPVEIDED